MGTALSGGGAPDRADGFLEVRSQAHGYYDEERAPGTGTRAQEVEWVEGGRDGGEEASLDSTASAEQRRRLSALKEHRWRVADAIGCWRPSSGVA